MRIADLPGVLAVQAACYGDGLVESPEAMQQRLACAGESCWVAQGQAGVVAYLLAYPSLLGHITQLHGPFHPAAAADTLVLHDLAVHPRASGSGLGPQLVACALQQARSGQLAYMALVSVQGSAPFWARQGFAPREVAQPVQQARLAAYGDGAIYMVRQLS